MFTRSADDSLQGQAIQAINVKWGEDVLARVGRESLALPVCKKKYKPFQFAVQKVNGVFQVTVERRYACACHDDARRKVIQQHGMRPGWENYGQWSLRKAHEMAKREASRLNEGMAASLTDDEQSSDGESCGEKVVLCLNGSCAWKVKSAYDDIDEELGRGGKEREESDR